jgi:endonuclease YncB( thermonuclease family)
MQLVLDIQSTDDSIMVRSAKAKLYLAWLLVLLSLISEAIAGQYHVIRVIDGDTIDVDHLNKKFTVRLVGIDAPELGKGKYDQSQPFARAAETHLTGLVSNRIVDIKPYGQDRYGRMLAEVFVDNKNVNVEMLKAGMAEVYRGDTHPAGLDLKPYWQAEEEARKARLGMWSQPNYMSPRDWRKSH